MATPHAGFLSHADYRYLKWALLLCAGCTAAYVIHDSAHGPSGGTWLGYGLGGLGALLILWLTALGVRKRSYRSTLGTVRGWTSAHVYLGLALIVVGTLHSGFQFGWNVHTLAYLLMLVVVLSGLYGIYAYSRYPSLITENMGASDRDATLDEILDINQQALKLADQLGSEVHHIMLRSIERMKIGGSLREQLFGHRQRRRRAEDSTLRNLLGQRQREPSRVQEKFDPNSSSTVIFMANELAQGRKNAEEAEKARQLLELISRRHALVTRINRDIQLHARMQVWIYLHVPLTVGLLVALSAHVFSVFLYW